VLFVVSLLKDRNGVINLDLPIEGTLDDPQFSIWGVVVQIIVNLLTKAVTAPFALLGAIAGGGGEQLSYVEFAPGSAVLTPAAITKLETLAKALSDRPALKLDAAGRAIADVEGDALRRAALDHALRVRKQKDLASEGVSAPALETIALDAADRAKYLKAVYGDADLPASRATSWASPRTSRPGRWRRCSSRIIASTTTPCASSRTIARRPSRTGSPARATSRRSACSSSPPGSPPRASRRRVRRRAWTSPSGETPTGRFRQMGAAPTGG